MKLNFQTAIGVVLVISLGRSAVAQIQTNLVPTNWTFTNLQGYVYSNATLRTATPASITFLWGHGYVGKADFTNLPESVHKMFHYDKAQADAFLAEQAALIKRRAIDGRIRREFNDQKARILATEWQISAEVFQVVKDGVLIKILGRVLNVGDNPLAMLWKYPSTGLVDGQSLRLKVYPIGTYQYETVNGSSKTIMQFTADLNQALQMDFLQTHPTWSFDDVATSKEQTLELQRQHKMEAQLRGMNYSPVEIKDDAKPADRDGI